MIEVPDRPGLRPRDPRWDWLQSAVQRLYAELDPDQIPAGMTLLLAAPEGPMAYSVRPDRAEVGRLLITDLGAVRPTSGYVDLTPPTGP